MAEVHNFRAMTPGALNGTKPKNYGTGRRCACGTKIMQYRKGDRCGLCEDNDELYARRVEQAQEEDVFGIGKWKSKVYPDGCRDCPEGGKFKYRHSARGLCAKHYQRAKVADMLPEIADPRMDGRLEREQAAAAQHQTGDEFQGDLDDEPVYTPNPEGCPRDAGETCCFDPDDCNPDRDGTRPEPGEDPSPSYSEYLMRQHSDALAEHFDTAARAEQALGVFNELTSIAREQAQGIQAITNQLHAEGIHVAVEPALLQGGYQPDAEVEAMELLRVALEPLDRDAQIRAVKWVTARFEIDRPLPASDAADIL